MKKLIPSILLLLMSFSSYATNIYFTNDRIERFACEIASSIDKTYPDLSQQRFRREILGILRQEIDPWVDAYPIPAGISLPSKIQKITGIPGFPMDRSEYYLQNAFILFGNPKKELKKPVENYLASYIHLARSRYIAYLNGETPKLNLKNEDDLLQQIEENLPNVANYTFNYLDEDGIPLKQKGDGIKEKKRFNLLIGNPNHKRFNELVKETQWYNHFVSPLFIWLLQQEDHSVSPEKLFDKALEIYEDPIVALGVIPWMMSGDALTVDRRTSSVVSHKVERIVEGNDIPGLQYHFWGYLTQSIIGNNLRVGLLAFLYEQIYQNDQQDWEVDYVALKLGGRIRSFLKKPKQCEHIEVGDDGQWLKPDAIKHIVYSGNEWISLAPEHLEESSIGNNRICIEGVFSKTSDFTAAVIRRVDGHNKLYLKDLDGNVVLATLENSRCLASLP